MRVYILTDIEGVSGVVNRSHTQSGNAAYEKARDWLTLDTNAAVQGAIDGGATDILVLDGHGANNAVNLVYENLHPGAKYVQGVPWAEYLQSLSSEFDGLFQVGAHAMAGTAGAVLEHTMSSESWVRMRINGSEMGEIGLCAAIAGEHGVPFAMVSGDDKACREAAQLCPGVACAIVKRGISRHCAELEPMPVAQDLIRQKACEAMGSLNSIAPLKLGSPAEIEIEYCRTEYADAIHERQDVARTGPRTVRFSGRTVTEAFDRVRGG